MDTLGSRSSFLLSVSILACLWGVSCDLCRIHFYDFSLIWGAKVGDGFQVHVSGDPGMEMMPEVFLVALGTFFVIFEGIGSRLEF